DAGLQKERAEGERERAQKVHRCLLVVRKGRSWAATSPWTEAPRLSSTDRGGFVQLALGSTTTVLLPCPIGHWKRISPGASGVSTISTGSPTGSGFSMPSAGKTTPSMQVFSTVRVKRSFTGFPASTQIFEGENPFSFATISIWPAAFVGVGVGAAFAADGCAGVGAGAFDSEVQAKRRAPSRKGSVRILMARPRRVGG